jgi:plastocyanin
VVVFGLKEVGMNRIVLTMTAGVLVLLMLVGATVVAALPPAGERTVVFGRTEQGTGCVFPCEDDASFHAVDKIVPGGLAIQSGTQVNFEVTGFHAVSIYSPGKTPRDVDVDPAAFPFVNDPAGRIAAGPLLTDFSYTFAAPGKYLVICEVAPHFEEANMWMWINVQ